MVFFRKIFTDIIVKINKPVNNIIEQVDIDSNIVVYWFFLPKWFFFFFYFTYEFSNKEKYVKRNGKFRCCPANRGYKTTLIRVRV